MRLVLVVTLLFISTGELRRAEAQEAPPASPEIQAETVTTRQAPPPSTQIAPAGEGFMEPAQVKELLQRLWLAGFRINDLFSEVHPERWKMPDAARASFQDSFEALRQQMEALEAWRTQFDARPDSMYLGYMTHASIDAILPRLDGVTRIISQRENTSLGAQFSQAGNQLFDLQQALQPYLIYLLRNQDQAVSAAQNNLASCESRLGSALRSQSPPAKVMKNIVPDFKGRRVRKPAPPAGSPEQPPKK
jgi:hypothetical protein